MASTAHTYRGRKVSISGTVQNDDVDETSAPDLTYTEITGVGNVGSFGPDTNFVSYNTLGDVVTSKQKGNTDAGSPAIECARNDDDAGQTALREAGKPDVFDNYVIKCENQDGSVDYLRGLVSGPVNQGGGNEDFDLDTYTFALNQMPVHTAASSS